MNSSTRLKVEQELMSMLENKTKTPPQYSGGVGGGGGSQEVVHHDIEEIYCSVEDLKTRTATRNTCVTTQQPIRGPLKELSFNKVRYFLTIVET